MGLIRRLSFGICLVVLSAAGSGCGGSSGGSDGPGYVQIVNVIVDSPSLQADVEDSLFNLNFRQGTGLVEVVSGNNTVEVIYIDPDNGDETTVVEEFELAVFESTIHTLVLHGTYDAPQLLSLDKPFSDIGEEDSEIYEAQVVNLSTGGALEVYISEPNLDPGNNVPVATLVSGAASDVLTLDAGDLRLRLLAEGETQVIYDSGEFEIEENTRRTFYIHDPVGPDPASRGSFQTTDSGLLTFPNEVARAAVRTANMVVDEASVNISVVDPGQGDTLRADDLPFTGVSGYTTVDPAFVNISAQPVSGAADVNTTLSLNEDTFYTVVVAGAVVDDSVSVRALPLARRLVATSAVVQFVNTLQETDIDDFDQVDFYVLPQGDELDDGPPLAADMGFLEGEEVLVEANGEYDLVVTTAETQSILAGPVRVTPVGGTAMLVLITPAAGGGTPYQLVTHNDG